MRVGPWKKHIPPKDDTPEVRRYAFDLCWRSGKLCRAVSTSDICKQELIALVSEMYETLAECSELLDVDIISGVKEKMRLNKKKYDEEECRVSNCILMQITLSKRTHMLSLLYIESKRNY